MPSPLPGPTSRKHTAPTLIADDGNRAGVLAKTEYQLDVTPKMSVTDSFTNLNNFVTVYGTPTVSSGWLRGDGIVRHKTEALTDSHKVTAVIGNKDLGKTRLFCCADSGLKSYYAVEIDSNIFFGDSISFIKGVPAASVESAPGLLGILTSILSLLFGLLSIFSRDVTPYATNTTVTLANNDEVGIWYDEPNSTVRIYHNDTAVLNVPVPRGEIPHGKDYRHHGIAVGIEFFFDFTGSYMTSYACEDV